MQKNNETTSCNIIKDLLPNYVDELCSEDSKKVIEEHLDGCENCRRTFEIMQAEECKNDRKEEPLPEDSLPGGELPENVSDKQAEIESDMAIFRAMKKVVWRRVFAMLLSIILGILTMGFLVVLVLAQFHPEWGILNYEQYQMKQVAQKATEEFAEGNIENFLAGIPTDMAGYYYTMQSDTGIYDIAKKQIQNIYHKHFENKKYTIEFLNTGWSSYEGSKPTYTVTLELHSKEEMLIFAYEFFDKNTYFVNIGGSDETAYALNEWCNYLTQSICVFNEGAIEDVMFHAVLSLQEKGEIDEEFIKTRCDLMITNNFTKDCMEVATPYKLVSRNYPDYAKGYPEYIKQWSNNLSEFLKNHTIEKIWTEDNGINQEKQKKIRTMIWKFKDNQGKEGIMTKEFYYGPAGFEPMDDTEKVYGDGLSKETMRQLEEMFD